MEKLEVELFAISSKARSPERSVLAPSSDALCSVRSFLFLVVRLGAPIVASERS